MRGRRVRPCAVQPRRSRSRLKVFSTAARSSAGVYLVKYPSLGADGDVQVTAYGGGAAYCKVASWSVFGVGVRCFSPGGAPADSQYTVTLLRASG